MNAGFIRDPLEIKFLILYIMTRIESPIPVETVQELTMIDEGIDYFTFSECLSDLVNTGHLYLDDQQLYSITPKGIKNSEIIESRIPLSVRMHTDENVAECNLKLIRKKQVNGTKILRENGTYTVELSLEDDVDNLMHLELMVANEEMANDLIKRFRNDPETVYSSILTTLFG